MQLFCFPDSSITQKFQYFNRYFSKERMTVMDFFDDGVANGGSLYSRIQLYDRIRDLYGKIEDENEKKEELLSELARTDSAIAYWKELLCDMEALLR